VPSTRPAVTVAVIAATAALAHWAVTAYIIVRRLDAIEGAIGDYGDEQRIRGHLAGLDRTVATDQVRRIS